MKRLFILPFSFLLFAFVANAQPISFGLTGIVRDIPVVTMPDVDAAAMKAEDAAQKRKDVPFRFGVNHEVNFNMQNAGVVESLGDGGKLWRLRVKCPGAFSVHFGFSNYHLPEGAVLYAYSPDGSHIVGPYTAKNNTWDNVFGTDLVEGEEAVLEYYEPAHAAFRGGLAVDKVTHAYRNLFKIEDGLGDSGDCQNNIKCPVAVDWQHEKRAVALIVVGGNALCTGSMVGNVALDGTPYFITADHCLVTGTQSNWVFRFNYESPQCTPTGNGVTNNTVVGATLKASSGSIDFALLLLNSQPNPNYDVYYAGWTNSTTAPTSATGIHHPAGDVKKISFDEGTAVSGSWSGNPSSHWIVDWDNGTTEGGSSGSPIFDQNHRIVGFLSGGPSGCDEPNLQDFYGKVSKAWNNGSSSANRLKDWLDPDNTGASFVDGYYPGSVGVSKTSAKSNFDVNVYPNPAVNSVSLNWSITTQNVSINLFDATGRLVQFHSVENASKTDLDLEGLAAGVYNVRVNAGSNVAVRKLTVVRP